MFTGIIQTTGVVRSLRRESGAVHLVLDAPGLTRPIPEGSSICVHGVCLTVARSDSIGPHFDVVGETIKRSTLGALSVGERVNLERSLRLGDPMDGHVVQGHVDGTGRVERIQTSSQGQALTIAVDDALMPFIIPKGAVAVDGVSLTVAEAGPDNFTVALIPTTLARTTLGALRVGDQVNLETDILVRTIVMTVRRWRDRRVSGPLSVEALRENGW